MLFKKFIYSLTNQFYYSLFKTFLIITVKVGDNIPLIWYISFKGAENTLYAGENFTFQFKFSNEYIKIFL